MGDTTHGGSGAEALRVVDAHELPLRTPVRRADRLRIIDEPRLRAFELRLGEREFPHLRLGDGHEQARVAFHLQWPSGSRPNVSENTFTESQFSAG